jgi:hypothetical protein
MLCIHGWAAFWDAQLVAGSPFWSAYLSLITCAGVDDGAGTVEEEAVGLGAADAVADGTGAGDEVGAVEGAGGALQPDRIRTLTSNTETIIRKPFFNYSYLLVFIVSLSLLTPWNTDRTSSEDSRCKIQVKSGTRPSGLFPAGNKKLMSKSLSLLFISMFYHIFPFKSIRSNSLIFQRLLRQRRKLRLKKPKSRWLSIDNRRILLSGLTQRRYASPRAANPRNPFSAFLDSCYQFS